MAPGDFEVRQKVPTPKGKPKTQPKTQKPKNPLRVAHAGGRGAASAERSSHATKTAIERAHTLPETGDAEEEPPALLGGIRGNMTVQEKINLVRDHGTFIRFFVDGARPDMLPEGVVLEVGHSVHALRGWRRNAPTAAYEEFDHTDIAVMTFSYNGQDYAILKNTPKLVSELVKSLEVHLPTTDELRERAAAEHRRLHEETPTPRLPQQRPGVDFSSMSRPTVEIVKHRDNMRSVSYPYAAKLLKDERRLADWGETLEEDQELSTRALRRVLLVFRQVVDQRERRFDDPTAGVFSTDFVMRGTIDAMSIVLELLRTLGGRSKFDRVRHIEAGRGDAFIKRMLVPLCVNSLRMIGESDDSQGLCYTERLTPSNEDLTFEGTNSNREGRYVVKSIVLDDRNRRTLHPRMTANDIVHPSTGNALELELSGTDLQVTAPVVKARRQYSVVLRMSSTSNNGHHMVAFDIDPDFDFDGVTLYRALMSMTRLRVKSGPNPNEGVPFYIENGGLKHGRVRLHIFSGVGASVPSVLPLHKSVSADERDTAACLRLALDGVLGLIVSIAAQTQRKRGMRVGQTIRVQAGVGSFYPVRIATLVGNLMYVTDDLGERKRDYTTVAEAHNIVGGSRLLQTSPGERVGSFIEKVVLLKAERRTVADSELKAYTALMGLYHAVHLYIEILRMHMPKNADVTALSNRDDLELILKTVYNAGAEKRAVLHRVIMRMVDSHTVALMDLAGVGDLKEQGAELINTLSELGDTAANMLPKSAQTSGQIFDSFMVSKGQMSTMGELVEANEISWLTLVQRASLPNELAATLEQAAAAVPLVTPRSASSADLDALARRAGLPMGHRLKLRGAAQPSSLPPLQTTVATA